MELSPSAVTTGFAAVDVWQGEGAAEKTSLVNDLRQAGAATPFTIGELRALHGASHFLYTIVYKKRSLSRAKTTMRICHGESKKGNSKRKRNLPYIKITDAESLFASFASRMTLRDAPFLPFRSGRFCRCFPAAARPSRATPVPSYGLTPRGAYQ